MESPRRRPALFDDDDDDEDYKRDEQQAISPPSYISPALTSQESSQNTNHTQPQSPDLVLEEDKQQETPIEAKKLPESPSHLRQTVVPEVNQRRLFEEDDPWARNPVTNVITTPNTIRLSAQPIVSSGIAEYLQNADRASITVSEKTKYEYFICCLYIYIYIYIYICVCVCVGF